MKSPRGFAAAVLFLAAVPIAGLWQLVMGDGAELVIHLVLGAGAALMAVAVFDFQTARWIAWTGSLSLKVLAVIFLLQAVSDLTGNASLTHFAYQVLGQRLEALAGDLFVVWGIAVLYLDSRGWTEKVGAAALALVVLMRGYAFYLSGQGTSLDTTAPALKLIALLPFVWLLLESRQVTLPPPPGSDRKEAPNQSSAASVR